MKIYTIHGKGISSNVHIIKDKKSAVIDAGIHEIASETIAEILELTEEEPDFLILTHRHVDHIGGAKEMKERFGLTVFAGKKDADAIRTADEWTTGSRDFSLSVFPVEVKELVEGDVINLGDTLLRVIETPGHTAGSISLYEEKSGSLFSGDTVFAGGGIGRWDLPTGDFQALHDSIERLSKMRVNSLYPGHGLSVISGAEGHIKDSLDSLKYYY